jgi:DNA-binding CsgD family transcriptional regulator
LKEDDDLRLTVRIDDRALAARIETALRSVPGIKIVSTIEDADAAVIASASSGGDYDLTPRELDVLALMIEGASNRKIAEKLGVSVHTAKFHVRRITDKLDAVGRTDAVAMAVQKRIIEM